MTRTVAETAGSWRAWLLAVRPRTLPASIAPVLLGWAVAATEGPVSVVLGIGCLLVAASLQVAANLANDYYDARSGVDQAGRIGPIRVTQSGLLRPPQVLAGCVVCLLIGLLVGLWVASQVGWWLLLLGAACLLGAVAYTAGPLPLARLGLGELAALVFFGPVACTGTAAVLGGFPPAAVAWLVGLIPGLHAAALMAVNNLRDRGQDGAAGKATLAVRLDERWARRLPVVCLLLGNLGAATVALAAARPLIYLALLLVPLSWPLLRAILRTPITPALNGVLAKVGRWMLVTCGVMAGLLLS